MENKRSIPDYTIAGTAFIVDVEKDVLRQKDKPENCIPFSEMAYHKHYYDFNYNLKSKNIAESITDETQRIRVPNLTELDPIGMAIKYGKTQPEVVGKTDVEVMVDQKQLALREGGKLPIIEIAGHPFYVDLRIDSLRPKDDFSTMGIRFSDIDDYYLESRKAYVIPYDPATHCLAVLDLDNIKSIPNGLIAIEIALEKQLDPLAYATLYGFSKEHILRNNPLQMHQKAPVVPWAKTPIKQIIANNIKRDLNKGQSQNPGKPKRNRGRGL